MRGDVRHTNILWREKQSSCEMMMLVITPGVCENYITFPMPRFAVSLNYNMTLNQRQCVPLPPILSPKCSLLKQVLRMSPASFLVNSICLLMNPCELHSMSSLNPTGCPLCSLIQPKGE